MVFHRAAGPDRTGPGRAGPRRAAPHLGHPTASLAVIGRAAREPAALARQTAPQRRAARRAGRRGAAGGGGVNVEETHAS